MASSSAMLREAAYNAYGSCLSTPISAATENDALTTALSAATIAQIQNALLRAFLTTGSNEIVDGEPSGSGENESQA